MNLYVSPDSPPTPEFHFERVTEALDELEANNPEIFKDIIFSPEEEKQMVQAMETLEGNEIEAALNS